MSMTIRSEVTILEGQQPVIVAQIRYPSGAYLTRANISGTATQEIRRLVYWRSGPDPKKSIKNESFDRDNTNDDTAPVFFDALQTDGYWDDDDIGYNMRDLSLNGPTTFARPGVYLVEHIWANDALSPGFGNAVVQTVVKVEPVGGL